MSTIIAKRLGPGENILPFYTESSAVSLGAVVTSDSEGKLVGFGGEQVEWCLKRHRYASSVTKILKTPEGRGVNKFAFRCFLSPDLCCSRKRPR